MKATDAIDEDWERRVAELWADIASYEPDAFLERMKVLAAELPEGNPQALYELASAYDSTGHPAQAAPLYRRAFTSGLTGSKHRQAVIQLAATLRTLGESEESVALLTAERERASDELDADVSAFLALALVDVGREREATALALSQLSRHLTRYGKSLENYAKELADAASAEAKRNKA
jgi:hypothetical protein